MTNHMSSNTLGRLGGRARMLPALPTASEEESVVDLVELGRILWQGKIWIAACVVLFVTGGWLWAARIAVPRYTAFATVILEPSQANVVDLESVVSGLGSDQMSVNTEAEVLMSRRLMERVAAELDLVADPEFNTWLSQVDPPPAGVQHDTTVAAVTRAFSVANLRASYVFRITALTADPAKSAALANTLAEVYVDDQLQVKFDATQAATSWLTERVAALKTELEASETAVQAFTAGTDLVSSQALEALSRQLKDNRARLESLAEARDAAAVGVETLRQAIATGDPQAIADAGGDDALSQLVENGAPAARIVARAEAVVSERADGQDRTEAQIASLRAAADQLATAYKTQSADLVRLEQMKREAEASRALYEYFLTRLKETAVQRGIQQADARVLSEAAVPLAPSSPRTGRILALSAVFGLIAGAAVMVFREIVNTGFRTAEALEAQTGHAVFGQIPRIRVRTRRAVIDHLIDHPTSAAAEAVRNLRTSLLLSNVDRRPKVILSTSAMPGEGKTTVALALAQNFAALGRKVLLMEGDTRHRVFGEYFDIADSQGLLSVLTGEKSFEAVVQTAPKAGIDVLTGGRSSANAADLFASDRFAILIAGLRKRYDVVIVDMPPVLLVPDTRIVAQLSDAVLFCVKWDHTSRAQVTEAIRQFEQTGAPITGLVLSQIDPRGMQRYGYGGKYGAYGSYASAYFSG